MSKRTEVRAWTVAAMREFSDQAEEFVVTATRRKWIRSLNDFLPAFITVEAKNVSDPALTPAQARHLAQTLECAAAWIEEDRP